MPAQTSAKPALFDPAGRPLHLGSQLGSGGEGTVYEVRDRSDLVMKLYHKPLGLEKSAKIAAMAKFGNERLLKLTAWPTEPIRIGSGTGPVVGFTMPRITGHKQAFIVYSPKLRFQEFPPVSWQFLIRSAANAARAFAVIHESGHVIGDVNDGNVFVGEKATVRLIDCDSYQITLNGSRWLCEVGTPPYQPPELQNIRTYKQAERTPNHDSFGLAVIIFRILFMGRHPFAGNFLGTEQMPMERLISENRFVYGSNAAAMHMRPPPASLGLHGVTRDVALLFERAFSRQGSLPNGRPRPDEWVRALQDLERHLKKCAVNPAHQFVDTLSKCPWCEIEAATNVLLFPIAVAGSASTGFTIAAFWARVEAVPNPGQPPPLPDVNGLTVTSSPTALELRQAASDAKRAVGRAALTNASSRIQFLKKEIEAKAADAHNRWQNIQNNWNSYTSDAHFRHLIHDLQNLRSQYDRLAQLRLQELQKLEANRYGLQLHDYLDRCRISHARIRGAGVAKKAMLQSYSIETAADIVDHLVLAVPGFGPVLLGNLKHWRDQQQRRFVFDPNKGVDQAAKNAVDRKILTEKADLERKLNESLSKLAISSHHILARRRTLLAQAEQAARDVAQAEVDLRTTHEAERELAQAEADLRASEQAARTQVQLVNARVIGGAILVLCAIAIGGLMIASQPGKGPSATAPQQMPQPQSQQTPPQPAAHPLPSIRPPVPPHVETDTSGQLHPEDGYDWSDSNRTSVRWSPGKFSQEHPHLIASNAEGGWQPGDGYDWAEPTNVANKSVKWVSGIASNRHPNVVTTAIEGQWRPADGYAWLLNPPVPGDMRVKPVSRSESAIPTSENPFQRGLSDRTQWEQWVAALNGDLRRGADWWAGRRSLPNAGSCSGLTESRDFVFGCEAAKARLTITDVKRKSDPEYRRGWNTYSSTSPITPPSVPDSNGTPVKQDATDPLPSSEVGSADQLNAQELKHLRGH